MTSSTAPSHSVLKTFKRNSLFLYASEIVPRLGSLFIVPIWTARIEPAEYARWILSLTSTEIIIGVSSLGFVSYMVKVLYRYHDERAYEYFGLAIRIVMLSTIVFALVIAYFSPFLSHHLVNSAVRPDLFLFLAIYLVFAQFNSTAILFVQYRIQYGSSLVLTLSRWAISVMGILYFLLVQHQGFFSWVWAYLLTEITIFPLSVYYLRHVKWNFSNKKMTTFAFRFSLPTLANQFLSWGQSRVGRYVLSFSGMEGGVGLLGIAQGFSQNYGALVRPAKLVAHRIIGHKLEADPDSPDFMEFFHLFSCLGLAIAFLAALFFQDIMRLFVAPSYWAARVALPPLIFGLYMEEIFTLYHALMFRHFKVWFDFSRTLLAFPTATIVTLILVPRLGFMGAALAQMTCAAIMWFYAQNYARRISSRSFQCREKMLLTLVAFGVAESAYLLHFSFLARIVLALAALTPFLLVYWNRRYTLCPHIADRLDQITQGSRKSLWHYLWI